MRYVGAYEAKTHLPRLLGEVEAGAVITITRNNLPVAVLSPVVTNKAARAVARIIRMRGQLDSGALSMRALIEDTDSEDGPL